MKSISLVSSIVKNVSVERINGSISITVVGVGVDAGGNEYPVENLVITWGDLPDAQKTNGTSFFKALSRGFNNAVSNEDVDTW